MPVYSNSRLIPQVLPSLLHRTLAGPKHDMQGLEIWSQSLDALAAIPPHRHNCEEVIIAVTGMGRVAVSGSKMSFSAGDTVIIPRNEVHQITNTGKSPLRLFSALNAAPVLTESPNGARIDMPWQQAALSNTGAMLMQATSHPTVPAPWSPAIWLWQCCLACFGRQDTQRQRIALSSLEDEQLRDIGLSRQEALDEIRKPFWK